MNLRLLGAGSKWWFSVGLVALSIGFATAQFRPGGNISREPGVPYIGTPEQATQGEQRLLEHPDDVGTVKALLDYYWALVYRFSKTCPRG